MSPPVPAWAGSTGLVLVSTGAGPRQGGRIRKWMARVQQGWQRAQRPLPGGPLPTPAGAVLSSKAAKSPSQERTGWRPSAEREADRGHPVSWPETPLSWHSRHKPLGHLQPCLQTTWLRQADLIPPTREDHRARKTQEQTSNRHPTDLELRTLRLLPDQLESSSLPILNSRGSSVSFINWRPASGTLSLNKDLLGPFSHLGPCGGGLGGGPVERQTFCKAVVRGHFRWLQVGPMEPEGVQSLKTEAILGFQVAQW